jgi:arylsulfatase A-like enzyme
MRPRLLLALSALLLFSALIVGSAACSREDRLNVVLITLDTTRADFLGAYGRPGNPTPHFDAVAAEGTRFDLAISTAAVTPVSHASILTGLDNPLHGLRVLSAKSGFRLRPGVPTLATVLREHGYRTGAVHSAFPVSSTFGFNAGFDVFESVEGELSGEGPHRTWDVAKLQRRSDETTRIALDFVKAAKQPFFLWVHYWDPHDAVQVPPKELLPKNLWRKGVDGDPEPSRELYAAEVSYVDAQFGRLVSALRERGELERTIFVIVADHGEGLGDHGWDHHRILYQEQIRVPLIVRIPGIRQAQSVQALVRTTDLFPTVLDRLGIVPPQPVSGESLLGLIEGRDEAPRVACADQINGYDWNARMVETHPLFDFLYCAMDREWKLIYRPSQPEKSELYDLAHDPGELANRFSQRPEEVRRLERELARWKGWVTAPFESDGSGVDLHASASALEALGYAGGEAPRAAEVRWAWTCPDHPDVRAGERGLCPSCGSETIPVRAHP